MKELNLDPDVLETDKVQYWANGIMLTAMMTREDARKLVIEGKAFVICSQAIGYINERGERRA